MEFLRSLLTRHFARAQVASSRNSGSLIWNNSLVRSAGEAVFYKNRAKAGVKNIKDLMNDEYEVITYRNFKETYCFHVSFLEFYGVASAIRSAMKTLKMKSQSENCLQQLSQPN